MAKIKLLEARSNSWQSKIVHLHTPHSSVAWCGSGYVSPARSGKLGNNYVCCKKCEKGLAKNPGIYDVPKRWQIVKSVNVDAAKTDFMVCSKCCSIIAPELIDEHESWHDDMIMAITAKV